MIYAVVGAGPRTGTSWVMGKIKEAGLPIFWTEALKIPNAKYDTHWNDLPDLNDVIVKVWPKHLSMANIGKMIVLRRNYHDQVKSIHQQIRKERKAGFRIDQTPHELIKECNWIIKKQTIPFREYRTEELNDKIDEIIQWFSEPFELQQRTG
jgi:hypothetical protein